MDLAGSGRHRYDLGPPRPTINRTWSQLLAEFERTAVTRGARRAFVTSFTFQAPGFYERHGYREIFRWDGVPIEGHADVHFRKDL